MRNARFRGDLSLAREGFDVVLGFGLGSLHGLVSVAELLQSSVYEERSLRRSSDRFEFTLLNPPLRMGAFRSARLIWNGTPLPADRAGVRSSPASQVVPFSSIDDAHPFIFPTGQRTVFTAHPEPATPGRQSVRLELQSVAIPPLVWFEFSADAQDDERAR
ncbi:MAG TPA: hypothetical protein VIZ68_06120 [Thermoplasmata archaeon]